MFTYLLIIYLFNREGEGGRKRERETSISCLSHAPDRGPGLCPDRESNGRPFALWNNVQPTGPLGPGRQLAFLEHILRARFCVKYIHMLRYSVLTATSWVTHTTLLSLFYREETKAQTCSFPKSRSGWAAEQGLEHISVRVLNHMLYCLVTRTTRYCNYPLTYLPPHQSVKCI